jgi:hypothetical protein
LNILRIEAGRVAIEAPSHGRRRFVDCYLLREQLVAGIVPSCRAATPAAATPATPAAATPAAAAAAKRQRHEARSVFTGFDSDACVSRYDFSAKFRGVRAGHVRRAAPDERRRQRETWFCNQDGRTVW